METLTLVLSEKFSQATLEAIRNAISLQALEYGATLSASLDGQTLNPFGQAARHAKGSPSRANKRASRTTATYGRNGSTSSASAVLTQYILNKLQTRLGTGGLIQFPMTWKLKATPSERLYSEHVLSARRTKDAGYTASESLWPTVRASPNENRTRGMPPTHGKTHGIALAGLVTETAMWATPTQRDHKSGKSNLHGKNARPLNEQVVGVATGFNAQTTNSGYLHPAFPCWLMGLPQDWLDPLPATETPLSRKSQQPSSKPVCEALCNMNLI